MASKINTAPPRGMRDILPHVSLENAITVVQEASLAG